MRLNTKQTSSHGKRFRPSSVTCQAEAVLERRELTVPVFFRSINPGRFLTATVINNHSEGAGAAAAQESQTIVIDLNNPWNSTWTWGHIVTNNMQGPAAGTNSGTSGLQFVVTHTHSDTITTDRPETNKLCGMKFRTGGSMATSGINPAGVGGLEGGLGTPLNFVLADSTIANPPVSLAGTDVTVSFFAHVGVEAPRFARGASLHLVSTYLTVTINRFSPGISIFDAQGSLVYRDSTFGTDALQKTAFFSTTVTLTGGTQQPVSVAYVSRFDTSYSSNRNACFWNETAVQLTDFEWDLAFTASA